MKMYGINILNEDVEDARYMIKYGGRKPIKKIVPYIVDKIEQIRKQIIGITPRATLKLIANKECPKCICGREIITKFNRNNPVLCNQLYNCTEFKKYRMNLIKKTNLKKYGVKNPGKNKNVQEKIAKTNLKRYGTKNVFASKKIRNKIDDINFEKYGTIHPSSLPEIRTKVEKTNFIKFGTKAPAQNPEIVAKAEATSLKRYGFINPSMSIQIKNKIAETNLKRYGETHVMWNKEIREKIRQTNLKRYGTENVFASKYGINKSKKAMLKRYGVEHALQHPIFFHKHQKSCYRYKWIILNNKNVRVQGDEDFGVKWLKSIGIPEKEIKLNMEGEVPCIDYQDNNGKWRTYYPDIMVYNTIIEVKSTWTLYGTYDRLHEAQLKAWVSREAGFKFALLLSIRKGSKIKIVKLPQEWEYMKMRHLLILVEKLKKDVFRIG